MQVQAGDFVQRGFNAIQYIKQIPKEEYKNVQEQITQLISQYKTQISPQQVSEVFENFQQNNKLLQFTETFMQLNNEINGDIQQEMNKIRQYEMEYLAEKKQIQEEIDRVMQYKNQIKYVIAIKQLLDKQPKLIDCLEIKNCKYYNNLNKWPDVAVQFQNVFNKQLHDVYVNLNVLQIKDTETVKQLLKYDFENYINYVNEKFTQKILSSLFDKYGQVDSTSGKLVDGIEEIFKVYKAAINTLLENKTSNFLSIIEDNNQKQILLHKQLVYLIKQIQNHFNTFFASACYNNNVYLLKKVIQLIKEFKISMSISELSQHILLANTLTVFSEYLQEHIDQCLENQNIDDILTNIKQVMDLYYSYPIVNKLKDNCAKQQPCGMFIPSLAMELVEQFQKFLKHIPETLQEIIDKESKTSSLYQNKTKFNFTKFKFLSQLTTQGILKGSTNPAFNLQSYKESIKKLNQFFNRFNRIEVSEIDYAIEPELNIQHGFEIYQLYVKTLNEQLELFINNEFKKFVLSYGLQ